MSYFEEISTSLNNLADKKQALILQRFFKTGPGQYGEGDIFLGIKVPVSRKIAVEYGFASLADIARLLKSCFHEYRLVGLFILVNKYERATLEKERKKIFDFYIKNTKFINNWDLVDLSAPKIVGHFLFHYQKKYKNELDNLLNKLADSSNLWVKRIVMISTFYFICQGSFKEVFLYAKKFLSDKHDLMHKAVGWMLRETGKRVSQDELLSFLDANISKMPRTTLRYAIEHLPEKQRKAYLHCRF